MLLSVPVTSDFVESNLFGLLITTCNPNSVVAVAETILSMRCSSFALKDALQWNNFASQQLRLAGFLCSFDMYIYCSTHTAWSSLPLTSSAVITFLFDAPIC